MLGQDEFNKFKDEANGQDPLIKRIRLADITLDDNSIRDAYIFVRGTRVSVTPAFFSRLGQIVNLNIGLMNRMTKHDDRAVQTRLLDAMKAYAQSQDGTREYLLIGDQGQHRITNIVRADHYTRLTNETLFNTAEVLLNEVPTLGIESIDRTNGSLNINLVNSNDHGFEKLGPDEIFRFGISLVNSPNGSRIDDFIYRLGCSNGMITKTPSGDGPDGAGPSFGSGPDAFRDVLNQAHIWSRNGFVPVSFQDRLTRAVEAKASYAEASKVWNMVEDQLKEEDPDRKIWLVKAAKVQLFPALEATERRLISKGYDPRALTPDQSKFIRTDRSVWDLINDMTWLGSHQSTFDLSNPARFKVEGGNLFMKKTWDLEHAALASV
jgi:hypothetical protein